MVNGFGFPASLSSNSTAVNLVSTISPAFSGTKPRLFINNGDGTFTEKSVDWKINLPIAGRGISCFDYDRDGDVDVAAIDQSVGLKFFENHLGSGAGRHFLNVRVVGQPPNTEALGAKVFVSADLNGNGIIDSNETQLRVSMANSTYNAQPLPDMHFGLAGANSATVKIVWPDGLVQTFPNVSANQFVIYQHP